MNTLQRAYRDIAVQTIGSDHMSVKDGGRERPQARQQPAPRGPVPQEIYKPARYRAEFGGSNVVEFVVDGEKGIRLSDALEGNWVGFEGRDDRTLFEGDRQQIILRLHVRHLVPTPKKK